MGWRRDLRARRGPDGSGMRPPPSRARRSRLYLQSRKYNFYEMLVSAGTVQKRARESRERTRIAEVRDAFVFFDSRFNLPVVGWFIRFPFACFRVFRGQPPPSGFVNVAAPPGGRRVPTHRFFVFGRRYPPSDVVPHGSDDSPGILLHGRDHFIQALLAFADLGVNFLDETVLDFGEPFDPSPLFAQLLHQPVSPDGDLLHPPKAHAPATGADERQPERRRIFRHLFASRGRRARSKPVTCGRGFVAGARSLSRPSRTWPATHRTRRGPP